MQLIPEPGNLYHPPQNILYPKTNKSRGKNSNKRRMRDEGVEFLCTPPWPVAALIKAEREWGGFQGAITDPNCGAGHISRVIMDMLPLNPVLSLDKYDHGYGQAGHDFFADDRIHDNIICNPPYGNTATPFIAHAIKHFRHKLCALVNLNFLTGARRGKQIYDVSPPSRIYVPECRVTFWAHHLIPDHGWIPNTGELNTCWMVWDNNDPRPPGQGIPTYHLKDRPEIQMRTCPKGERKPHIYIGK